MNYNNKKNISKTLLIVCVCILALVAIFGVVSLINNNSGKVNASFSIGGLDKNGAYLETKSSIYTKEAFKCAGLDIDLAFDNNISYSLYFYDTNGKFMTSIKDLTTNFNDDVPVLAELCRVVVTPNADNEITWNEIAGYANQLTIKADTKSATSYSSDLLLVQNFENNGPHNNVNGVNYNDIMNDSEYDWVNSKLIEIEDYSTIYLVVDFNDCTQSVRFYEFNADKLSLSMIDVTPTSNECISYENGVIVFEYDVENANVDTKYIAIDFIDECDVNIYGVKA